MSETTPSDVGLAARVHDEVRARRADFVDLLERLAENESPSSDPASQGPVFDVLEAALDSAGFECRRLPGEVSGGQLVAAPAGQRFGSVAIGGAAGDTRRPDPAQLLIGHCDTVWDHGTLDHMPIRLEGSILSGPGVFDMKSGLAQTVLALQTVHALELQPAALPLLLVNSDEEIGSPDSADLIVRLAAQVRRTYVMEPALGLDGRLKTARKGVGRFVVDAYGKTAHAGLDPEGGASAVLELAVQVQRLFELNDPQRGISVNVGLIEGGTRPNVIAGHSRAVVDVRVPDAAAAEDITARIRGLVAVNKDVRLEVSGDVERSPLERNVRNQALWHAARRLAGDLGFELQEGFAGGGSDGNLTSLETATLDGLGAVGDGAHASHEHIDVDRSLERCALLALLLLAEEHID